MTQQLHQFCDRIVAINLPYKPERRAALTRNLGETGLARPDDITWTKAISGDRCPPPSWWGAGNGAWGYLMSHIRAVRKPTWHGLAARGPRNVVSGKNPGRKRSVSRGGKAFRKRNLKEPEVIPGKSFGWRTRNVHRTHAFILTPVVH